MNDELAKTLAELVAVAARGRVEAAQLEADTALLTTGVALDSVEVLELVVSIEERLGVELTQDDLAPVHWASFAALLRLVQGRLAR